MEKEDNEESGTTEGRWTEKVLQNLWKMAKRSHAAIRGKDR